MKRIDLVAGARPNFMKLAPVDRALRARGGVDIRLVHTGQHYDHAMSATFLDELGLPVPDVDLEAGSGTHGAQTARILERYEALLLEARPDATVVFGDVNSTLACALAAAKLHVPVVHVEAGLRSHDRAMPEEINRVLTDALADLLLVTDPVGVENLAREGFDEARIALVGNPMIDTLVALRPEAERRAKAASLGLVAGKYACLTLHRPANVDDPATLARLVEVVLRLAERIPVAFPVHPRTKRALARDGLARPLDDAPGVRVLDPQPYLDHLSLLAGAGVVVTDSGGIQPEVAFLGVPCVTLRDGTEHRLTVEVGGNRVVGTDPAAIEAAVGTALDGTWGTIRPHPLWDGHAGERAADCIARRLGLP